MFFEKENLCFNILDVLTIKQKSVNMFNAGRNFSALSFRFRADTVLKTKKEAFHLRDNALSYVPARADYSRTSALDELIVVHFDAIDYFAEDIEVFIAKNPGVLAELFVKIQDCWDKKEAGYKYKCSAILCEIFAECYSQNFQPAAANNSAQNGVNIRKSVEFIQNNYKHKELYMSEIAKQSFISEVYFRKLFKAQYGTSPQKYIIQLRMQNALGLISTGYYSLKEVAEMSGYPDYKHFTAEFKKTFGLSPSAYSYNYYN